MNFSDLYKKIADLDRTPVSESTVEECGAMPTSNMPSEPPKQPMSMTVNLNAQGEQDISSLMRLLTKVNPDMMPKGAEAPMPTVGPELSIGGPGAKISSPTDDLPKLIPDLSKDKGESFKTATTEPDPEYKDVDYMVNKLAGGLNRPKGTHPKVADGDNPMQKIAKEDVDLRSEIRADLARRLAEMKK